MKGQFITPVLYILIISIFIGCSSHNRKQRTEDFAGKPVNNATRVVPLSQAFAHNDYQHENPLYDALANGFTVIEADIHLIDGDLYVTHDPPASVENVSSLKELYLDPLLRLVRKNNGFIYPGYEASINLMIDLKTDAESTYAVLRRQLLEYSVILSTLSEMETKPKPVRVFISGNRPVQTILEDSVQLAGVDGRLSDLEQQYSVGFMPMISENFSSLTDWNGTDPIPTIAFERLQSLSSRIHQQGKKFRLWGTPENEYAWKVLLDAGVDYICTDDLVKAKLFLLEYYAD